MLATLSLPTRWPSSTPVIPTMYSDRIIDEELCNSTCQPLRLNRVMSGQVTAPVMNPPAMVVAAAAMVSGSPDGGTAEIGRASCRESGEGWGGGGWRRETDV